jgi:hypothetical protein
MLNELIADIARDFTDEEGEALAPIEHLENRARRALPLLAADIGIAYRLDGDAVIPEMPGDQRELWALRVRIDVCRLLRTQAATRVNFSSGDKKMDRSREAANWAALEKDLQSEYALGVKRINPMADEDLLALDAYPVLYKRGSSVE